MTTPKDPQKPPIDPHKPPGDVQKPIDTRVEPPHHEAEREKSEREKNEREKATHEKPMSSPAPTHDFGPEQARQEQATKEQDKTKPSHDPADQSKSQGQDPGHDTPKVQDVGEPAHLKQRPGVTGEIMGALEQVRTDISKIIDKMKEMHDRLYRERADAVGPADSGDVMIQKEREGAIATSRHLNLLSSVKGKLEGIDWLIKGEL